MSNRGAAGIIVVIVVLAVVAFSIPLLAMSEKTYDAAQEAISATTEKLKSKVIRTAEFTEGDYEQYLKDIQATGTTVDVNFEIRKLSENAAKKTSSADGIINSSDNYTIYYTTNIFDYWKTNNGTYKLEPGDGFYVEVKSTNRSLKEIFSGRKSTIVASSSGVVGK